MHFPTWVDLKGEDAVPDTVHHVVVPVDPRKDLSWQNMPKKILTDGVHAKDRLIPTSTTPGISLSMLLNRVCLYFSHLDTMSEAVKILKGEYCVRAIREQKMDQAIIFCRTKLDCDNLEWYLNSTSKLTVFVKPKSFLKISECFR